ncbi:MAG: hypothetical protein Q4E17_00025 [Synergistes sp.]|nr:hypothetical protein [Synergistes sp.]
MKKIILLMLSFALLLSAAAVSFADDEYNSQGQSVSELIKQRQVGFWIEGTQFGDMILGARAKMQVIYMDKDLSTSIARDKFVPEWLTDMAQYWRYSTLKKKVFVAYLETNKPMNFDYTKLSVGGYLLQKDDILSPSMTNPFGDVASGEKASFAFTVPASVLKSKKEIKISYGDDFVIWKIVK